MSEKTGSIDQETNKKADTSTSGYTEELETEMKDIAPMPIENAFGNLMEIYVSSSGHTRLFSATKYGKRYVLKCLKKDFLFTPVYQQALTKEFEIGLQLEHPYIGQTLGLERVPVLGDTIVMEYIDGDTLASLIKKKELSSELAHKIASQLMDALAYMHSKQIVHRDLKPSNIMVTHSGKNVKIIDFGLSDSDAFCVLKFPAGTTGYMAPEQLLPGAKSDPRADIYSLGMVIADMAKITGDKDLSKMAKLCSIPDARYRPDSIEKLRGLLTSNHRQSHIIGILCLLILALLGIIGYTYYLRHQASTTGSHQQAEDSFDQDSLLPNDNKVIDYKLWNNGE